MKSFIFIGGEKEQLSKLKCNLSNFRPGMIYHII